MDGSGKVGRSTEMKERENGRRMEKKSGKELEERSCQEKMMEEEEEGGRYRRCLERMKELLRGRCAGMGELREDRREKSMEARGRRSTEVKKREDGGRMEKNLGKGWKKGAGKRNG